MTNERLCTLAQLGDTQAQEQLIQNNLGYIRKTANELYISVGQMCIRDRPHFCQSGIA